MHPSLRHRPEDFIDLDETRFQRRAAWVIALLLTVLMTAFADSSSEETDFEQEIQRQASTWLDRQVHAVGGKPRATIGPADFAPIDPRVRPSTCHTLMEFDQPFPNQPSQIRARCSAPQWTIFLVNQSKDATAVQRSAPARDTVSPAISAQRVLVAKVNIPANQPLDPALFEIKEIALTGPLKTYFTTAEGLEFSNVITAIPAGKPLRAAELRSAVLIKRGQPVVLAMERVPGLNISIKMTALEDGRFGEQIKLRNMESGKTTTGLVSGWAQVSMR